MMLRLVLVGIVAGLGVTIPSQQVGQGWLGSADRWASSLLADWDTWRPEDSGHQRVAAIVHECEQCRLARSGVVLRERKVAPAGTVRLTRWAPAQPAAGGEKPTGVSRPTRASRSTGAPVIAFDPIQINGDFYAGVAFELNKGAEGIDLPQPNEVSGAVASVSPPAVVTENTELDLPEVLCGATDEELAVVWSAVESVDRRSDSHPGDRGELVSTGTIDDGESGEPDVAEVVGPVVPPALPPVARIPLRAHVWDGFDLIACEKDSFEIAEDAATGESREPVCRRRIAVSTDEPNRRSGGIPRTYGIADSHARASSVR